MPASKTRHRATCSQPSESSRHERDAVCSGCSFFVLLLPNSIGAARKSLCQNPGPLCDAYVAADSAGISRSSSCNETGQPASTSFKTWSTSSSRSSPPPLSVLSVLSLCTTCAAASAAGLKTVPAVAPQLLSCDFIPSPEVTDPLTTAPSLLTCPPSLTFLPVCPYLQEVIRQHITFRYSAMKVRCRPRCSQDLYVWRPGG